MNVIAFFGNMQKNANLHPLCGGDACGLAQHGGLRLLRILTSALRALPRCLDLRHDLRRQLARLVAGREPVRPRRHERQPTCVAQQHADGLIPVEDAARPMLRVWVEEGIVEVVEYDVHRGADVAERGRLGGRGVELDAGRDHAATLARELDIGARQQRSPDLVLLRGARGEHLSSALLAGNSCGVDRRVHMRVGSGVESAAPHMGGANGTGFPVRFSPGRPSDGAAVAVADLGSASRSSGG